jgi:hypothetical protein
MGIVEEQAALAAESWRRSNPNRDIPAGSPPEGIPSGAGLQIGDTWSSAGMMPGKITPDLQGPVAGPTSIPASSATQALPMAERPINPLSGADRIEDRGRR